MKVRKVYIVSFTFAVCIFLLCIILGFSFFSLPELIDSTKKTYKFLNGLKHFLEILPEVLATGFLVGWAFDFGEKPDGSLLRFSSAMFGRYKNVITDSLIAVLVVMCVNEIALPSINNRMGKYAQLPNLQKEYTNFAEGLYNRGRYNLAYEFSKLAYDMNPKDKKNAELLDKAEVAAKHSGSHSEYKVEQDISKLLENSSGKIMEKKSGYGSNETVVHTEFDGPYSIYSLMNAAKKSLASGDLFGAHYYAQTAISACSLRDINLIELKQIAAEAWNKISQARAAGTTEEQRIFAKKLEGYNALISDDNLKAYYIFRTLSLSSKKLSLDPDVVRYLDIAESRLLKQYFFTDETFNMQGFESSNSVYFKIKRSDGCTDVFYIKGVTNTELKSGLVQYLRGMSVFTLDENSNYISGVYVPYAKMTGVSSACFDDETRSALGIEDYMKNVPYILLNSVDRDNEGMINKVEIVKGGAGYTGRTFILLPMDVSDFSLLKEVSDGIDSMKLSSVYKFAKVAEKYGFAGEVYWQSLINRLFFSIFFLICMVCVGVGAWHGRIPPSTMFKFKWLIVFLPIFFVFVTFYNLLMPLFGLVNYCMLSLMGNSVVFVAALGLYAGIFFVVSVGFLGCNNSMDRN